MFSLIFASYAAAPVRVTKSAPVTRGASRPLGSLQERVCVGLVVGMLETT